MANNTLYVIETRRTVGPYRLVAASWSEDKAREMYEQTKINAGFDGSEENIETAKKEVPGILVQSKRGGTHDNTIVRIRMMETDE